VKQTFSLLIQTLLPRSQAIALTKNIVSKEVMLAA